MTDEKDFTAEMKRLIQEVEKLRDHKRCHHSKSYINDLREQIDSLTKERDRYKRQNQLYSLASNFEQVLAQAERIEELEAKNAEWNEKNLNNINEKEAK